MEWVMCICIKNELDFSFTLGVRYFKVESPNTMLSFSYLKPDYHEKFISS
jgi:hypothetical protein